MLGRVYNYVTPGEMYSDYYGGNSMRALTVLVATNTVNALIELPP